ncbi:MAG: C10 family peptidase [Muribaculaceae bacterium]
MKKFTLLLALAAIALPVGAKQIDTNTAQTIAKRFGRENSALRATRTQSTPELAYTATNNGDVLYYVFNQGNGFTIVAGDDCAAQVLGYSDEGNFDINNINPELKWWLSQYEQEISTAIANGEPTLADADMQSFGGDRAPIKTLATSRWNQGAPYNNACPIYSESQRCVTGCVATAMAQVMYYHKWPEAGTGSNSYSTEINGSTQNVSMDFSTITFDWANMTDTYNSSSTDAQNRAVATLMSACGVSVDMGYGLSSGTQTSRVVDALYSYFDYDRSVHFMSRDGYDFAVWEETIYNELAAARPILFSGQSSGGGHCFVCDGYNSGGYYHFNWGWGGSSDGYFLLTALNPTSQGIGGSSSDDGFNSQQGIIINIKKQAGSTEVYGQLLAYAGINCSVSTITSSTANNIVYFPFGSGQYGMKSNSHADAQLAKILAITNTATNTTTYLDVTSGSYDPANYRYSGFHSAYIYGNNAYFVKGSLLLALPVGTYQIKAMTYNKASGEYKPVLIPSGGSTYITAECDGTKVTLTPEEVGSAKLEVKGLNFASKLYSGQDFMIAVSMQSRNAEYLNDVSLSITQGEGRFATLVYESDPAYLAIPVTKPYTYVFKGTIPEGLSGDNFNLQVKNGNGSAVYSETVSISAAPTDALKLTLAGCSLNGVLNVNNVYFTADIKCEQGFFGGKITPYAYDAASDKYTALASDQAFVIESGTTYTVQFFANSSTLPLGKEYELRLMARPSSGESSTIIVGPKFTTSDVSGITDIKADAAVNHSGTVNVYDVQGRKLYSADAESFDINDVEAKGVLIIRSAAGVQKVVK